MSQTAGAGAEHLKQKRGEEKVTFSDVADHLIDFAQRHPEVAETVDRLARFLAGIEDVPHDHDATEAGSK